MEPLTTTEPIVGYRVWDTATVGGQLYLSSVAYKAQWPYRKALEVDVFNNKGIHALKNVSGLQTLWMEYCFQANVAGEVYLWGRVTECEFGYLAEFAYPKRLFVPEDTDPTVIMQLEDGYGVPCEMRGEFVRVATPTVADPLGIGISTISGMLPGGIQAQWQMQQQYYQQAQTTAQQNAAAMMQNMMLYGTGLSQAGNVRTYPGGIFTVDPSNPYGI